MWIVAYKGLGSKLKDVGLEMKDKSSLGLSLLTFVEDPTACCRHS